MSMWRARQVNRKAARDLDKKRIQDLSKQLVAVTAEVLTLAGEVRWWQEWWWHQPVLNDDTSSEAQVKDGDIMSSMKDLNMQNAKDKLSELSKEQDFVTPVKVLKLQAEE
jgi:hypothetical protein